MKLQTIFISVFLLTIFSCTTQIEKLVNSVKNNDVETVEKIINEDSFQIDCDSQVFDLFNYAIHSKNERIVKTLINSDLFDCIKNNEEIISEILFSPFNYDVKIEMINNGVDIDLEVLDNRIYVPIYYWMAQNALPKDFVKLSDKITNYEIVINNISFVNLLVLNHHDYIDKYHIDQETLNTKDSKGDTPLALAIKRGLINVVMYFIDEGATLSDISNDNTWFLLTRNWRDGYIQIADTFIKNGLLLSMNNNGIEAFKGVLFSRQLDLDGQVEILKWLILNGFSADQIDAEGKSAEDYLWEVLPSIDEPNEYESLKKKEFQRAVLDLLGDDVYSL